MQTEFPLLPLKGGDFLHEEKIVNDGERLRFGNFPDQSSLLPYVLISGSYKEDDDNDILCKMLGAYLSKYLVGIISGAGKSGIMVSNSLCETLIAESRYDPDRIICYLRRKEKEYKALVDTMGTVKFYGNQPVEMRQKMISRAMAVIIIGGKSGTKQEEQLAVINNIPVIPIARTGGTAYNIWEKQKQKPKPLMTGLQPFDVSAFDELNSKNIHVAVKATISILKRFPWFIKGFPSS